jgi:IclR family pca regulon transcriptional regulator
MTRGGSGSIGPSLPDTQPGEVRIQSPRPDREFVQGLERGLSVIKAFGPRTRSLTVSQVAERAGLTRAVARRYLLTLKTLGYVAHNRSEFSLTPRVLELGFAYLSTIDVADVSQPLMAQIVEILKESCSVGVLDGSDVVYVARLNAQRIMTTNLVVGSRLPAHATSMGKVLLAFLPPTQLEAYLSTTQLWTLTQRTISDEKALHATLERVRRQGWAANDQESEIGVRTIAVPIRNRSGDVVAAINVAGHASRVSMRDLKNDHLPVLLKAAAEISHALGHSRAL